MSSSVNVAVCAAAELELRRRRDHSGFASDPVGFTREILGIERLTKEQIRILISIRDNSQTNVQAAHGVGKSFICAIVVLWWVFAVGGLAISTAPTRSQVEQILWHEIRQLYDRNKHKLGGSRNALSVKKSESARAYGFTSKDYDSNSFQGKHAEKLLLIQDESCGITEEIDDGFEACLTGSENRGVRIGNPIEPNTPFHRACLRSHIRIPAWDHPNVLWAYELCEDGIHRLRPDVAAKILKPEAERGDDPVLPQSQWAPELPRDVIPGAISINWIEKIREKRKEKSPYWMTRVEGMFNLDSDRAIIPRTLFMAARARYDNDPAHWDNLAKKQPWKHGLDVGDGNDPHALASWRGPVLYAVDKMATLGDLRDVSRAAKWGYDALQARAGTIGVDKIGVGSGSLSELRGMLEFDNADPDQAFGVNFGASSTVEVDDSDDQTLFNRLKAELFWELREDMMRGDVAIAPLGEHEDELMDDFAGLYYEENSKGEICMEKKEKTRKRLHRSPDCADSVVNGRATPPERGVWGISAAGWSH